MRVKIRGKFYPICGSVKANNAIQSGRSTKWWRKFNSSVKSDKILMLQSRTKGLSVTSKDTYLRNRSKKFKPTGNCEVCGEKAYCQHHITPLYNGGTNQFMNRINICRNCHVEVHTWMIPDTPKEIRDMDISFSKTIS